ncbi:hypothetical protein KFK09_004780 [Dendrobium nobile]|uniref:Uncharacterized protein n=1 Tax=Dendrobium nobile TaxID=94219 RepID=A0A8T3BWI2_DENNO|nr:hypothetical protein KFK09_004780 [Dendrobium nobile]
MAWNEVKKVLEWLQISGAELAWKCHVIWAFKPLKRGLLTMLTSQLVNKDEVAPRKF